MKLPGFPKKISQFISRKSKAKIIGKSNCTLMKMRIKIIFNKRTFIINELAHDIVAFEMGFLSRGREACRMTIPWI